MPDELAAALTFESAGQSETFVTMTVSATPLRHTDAAIRPIAPHSAPAALPQGQAERHRGQTEIVPRWVKIFSSYARRSAGALESGTIPQQTQTFKDAVEIAIRARSA